MRIEQVAPCAVTKPGSTLCRADDVSKKHCGKHSACLGRWFCPGEQLLNFVNDRVPILSPPGMVCSWKLKKSSARNVLGQITTFFYPYIEVILSVHNERGHMDRRQDVTNVYLSIHLHERKCSTGAGGTAII